VITVFIDSAYLTGYFFIASSILYNSGKPYIILEISFSSIDSEDLPPSPPVASAEEHDKIEFKSKFVSLISFVISAFG
jgi:hypothetical protein